MILRLKVNLKDLIYLIKKKLKRQLEILITKWMKQLKNFIKQKKDKEKDDDLSL